MDQSISRLSRDLAYDLFSKFTEQTSQAIFIVDLRVPKILYINPAGQDLWDVGKQNGPEALEHLIQMIHDEDREHTLGGINNYLKGNGSNNVEFRVISKDPHQWICLTLYSMEDGKGEKIQLLAIAENITHRKEYELFLFRHNAKKNSILNILSHDLRGPLSNIALVSRMLKEQQLNETLEEAKSFTEIIERTCTQALDLINQYVNKELLESSNIEVIKTRVEIVGRINSVVETLKTSNEQLNRIFKVEALPRDTMWLEVDDVKLLQVINNLISNAIKFTRAGGTINIKLEEAENALLVAVQDNGIGIPEELHPLLFDEFTKARRKGLKGEETIGLGLSISKKLIELMGGKLWFESKEGVGTTFFIDLPIKLPPNKNST
jgi:two-component system sensor histidine kinase VicK